MRRNSDSDGVNPSTGRRPLGYAAHLAVNLLSGLWRMEVHILIINSSLTIQVSLVVLTIMATEGMGEGTWCVIQRYLFLMPRPENTAILLPCASKITVRLNTSWDGFTQAHYVTSPYQCTSSTHVHTKDASS